MLKFGALHCLPLIVLGRLDEARPVFEASAKQHFADLLGVENAYACTSGTAAIHTAIAAINPEPGDEIITTPITDMGALTPIIYQGAVPVFSDVDPVTLNVTPETIEARISNRTKAIIVTHLFGSPCDMTGIMQIADAKGIAVIEDCAQSPGALYRNRLVGTIGDVGVFSFTENKNISSTFFCCDQCFYSILRICLIAIKEVLGIIDHFLSL